MKISDLPDELRRFFQTLSLSERQIIIRVFFEDDEPTQ